MNNLVVGSMVLMLVTFGWGKWRTRPSGYRIESR